MSQTENLNSLAEVGVSEVTDPLTVMAEDTEPIVVNTITPQKLRPMPDISHTIDNMLCRETRIGYAAFVPTANYNTFTNISSIQDNRGAILNMFPAVTLLASSFIRNRLQGYRYFSFDKIRLTVTWNLNPFLQGKVGLFWCPDGINMAKLNLPCVTAYPGVMADINTSTSLEVDIPWSAPIRAYDLLSPNINNVLQMIRAQLLVMVPISSADTYNLTFQAYAQFENPQLFAPTTRLQQTIVPTGDDIFGDGQITPATPEQAVEQVNPSSNESKKLANGTVSTALKAGSGLAKSLTFIPGIGSAMSFASSALDIVGNVAASFGWSKPFNDCPVTRVVQTPAINMGNCTGDDLSVSLSADRNALVDPTTFHWCTSDDEMTISYIGEREAGIGYVIWPEAAVPGSYLNYLGGTTVDHIPIRHQSAPGSVASDLSIGVTPGEFIVQNYQWMHFEKIVYNVDFAKTPFHNGKLEVGIRYGNPTMTSTSGADTQQFNNTMIIDVLNRKEFSIEIPFMYNKYWMSPNEVIGDIYLKVVSPLISNPNVADEIAAIVTKKYVGLAVTWYAPHKNPFTVQEVVNPGALDLLLAPQGTVIPEETEDYFAYEQVNLAVNNDSVALQGGTPSPPDEKLLATTVGEAVLSLRKTLKMFCNVPGTGPPTAGNRVWEPSYILDQQYMLRNISKMFFFYRGGFRLKSSRADETARPTALIAYTNAYRSGAQGNLSHFANTFISANKVQEVALPYYGQVPFRYVLSNALSSTALTELQGQVPCAFITNYGNNDKTHAAIGEDFSFYGLRGVPPIRYPANGSGMYDPVKVVSFRDD